MLAVQKFLHENTLEDLNKQFGIKIKIYDNFVGLNYDQIESPKSHPITLECRSLKLVKNTWEIASRAFDRFFNYGECPDQYAKFDFKTAVITEKADGSIIPIWYNAIDKRWEISSKSAIFGESSLMDTGKTYRQAVLDVLTLTEEAFQQLFGDTANKNYTYIFEYIGPDNFIVTPYKDKQLVLIGIRDNFAVEGRQYSTLEEMQDFVNRLPGNVRLFKTYKLGSFDDILLSLKELKSLEEGYVCWDLAHDLRVKIKSPQYVAMHHMRGQNNITKEGLINVVLNGEIDEFVVYFPHLKEKLEDIRDKINKFINDVTEVYNKISGIKEQKDFAKEVAKYKFRSLLFSARKNKNSIDHEFSISNNDYKLKLVMDMMEKTDKN